MKINLSNFPKYYYILFMEKNFFLTSNSHYDGKIKVLNKLKNANDISIIRITLKKVTKKQIKQNEKSKIKLIGGPIYAEIKEYLYINKKLKNIPKKPKNIVYFPLKYFDDLSNKKIKEKILNDNIKIAKKYINNKLPKNLLQILKINNI